MLVLLGCGGVEKLRLEAAVATSWLLLLHLLLLRHLLLLLAKGSRHVWHLAWGRGLALLTSEFVHNLEGRVLGVADIRVRVLTVHRHQVVNLFLLLMLEAGVGALFEVGEAVVDTRSDLRGHGLHEVGKLI